MSRFRMIAVVFALVAVAMPARVLAQATPPRFATVTARSASVYETPDEEGNVKTKVKRGEFLEVGGMKGNWVKIRTKGGIVGYVLKGDVVPGKKELDGGGVGSATPAKTPRPGRSTGVGSGVTVEGRTGLLSKAGLAFAANSYSFKAADGVKNDIGMKTTYAGINADVDYWFIPLAGAHVGFSTAFGAMTAVMKEPINKRVDRIPTNINVIEIDGQGRYFLNDEPGSPSVLGRVGFHQQEMRIDPVVNGADEPLFLVSNTYRGPVVGAGVDLPLGGPQLGIQAVGSFWVATSMTEGSTKGAKQPSGKPKGASGVGFNAGLYYNLNDQIGVDAGIEYASFAGSFSGTGRRFNTNVRNAKTTDTYVHLVLNGTYRF